MVAATSSASCERSEALTFQSGRSAARLTATAPDPVQTSWTRRGRRAIASPTSRAAVTRVSVSGLGTRTLRSTRNSR
ncbi:hypothetical protein LWX53_03435, partial [bacterium]|nr:hypothetical protein [bacterium]